MQEVTGSTPVFSTQPDISSGFFNFVNFQRLFIAARQFSEDPEQLIVESREFAFYLQQLLVRGV